MAYELYNNFLDDLFDNVNTNNTKTLMRTNVKENDNGYILEIEIPGVKKENIKLEYHDKYLKVFYKTEEVKNEEENGKYLRRERFSGSFSRSYFMPDVDSNNIEAAYENGVLKVSLAKKKETAFKSIEIK